MKLSTRDYLFMIFRTPLIELSEICKIYYPHLKSKKVIHERVREMHFPFLCFKLDNSTNAPYFVNIDDLATAIDKIHSQQAKDFNNFHR